VDEALPTHVRWLLGGGAIAYFATRAVLAAVSGAGWRWQLAFGLPGVVVPALVGAFGAGWRAFPVTAMLLLTAFWQTRHRWLARRTAIRLG
jgi:hypothetical protein